MRSTLLQIGASHQTAPVEVREQLAVQTEDLLPMLRRLHGLPAIEEIALLGTCNRVEILAVTDEPDAAVQALRMELEESKGLTQAWIRQYTRERRDREAVAHLFRVSSSLDSLIVGEPQIMGQVRSAYRVCQEAGTTGRWLHRLFHHAFRTAKRVRTETRIAENAVSISFAAVELARKVLGNLGARRVLVLGAGKMGGLVVKHLRQAGVQELTLMNRSLARAEEAARTFGGRAATFDTLEAEVERADIVISSTGAQHFLLSSDLIQRVQVRRKFRRLFLVDIAVPRDVDPACSEHPNVFLFDVDDLGRVVADNLSARQREAVLAERIIEDETDAFLKWVEGHQVVPTIVQLREKLTRLKEQELQRMARANPELGEDALDAATRMAHSLINKILHEPTLCLREAGTSTDGPQMAEVVRELFGLDETPGDRMEDEPLKEKLH